MGALFVSAKPDRGRRKKQHKAGNHHAHTFAGSLGFPPNFLNPEVRCCGEEIGGQYEGNGNGKAKHKIGLAVLNLPKAKRC